MKNSKIVKGADDFKIRYAFKSIKRHRTERFKSFFDRNHIETKNATVQSNLRQINPLVKLWI